MPPSVSASKVLQCTHLRLLIQSYTVYINDTWTLTCLGGGWKLAHLCRLDYPARVKLIGNLREYTIGDMEYYITARTAYIIERETDVQTTVNRYDIDTAQVSSQLEDWLTFNKSKFDTSASRSDQRFTHSIAAQVEMLLDWTHHGSKLELHPSRQAIIFRLNTLSGTLCELAKRIEENAISADINEARGKMDKEINEVRAYIEEMIAKENICDKAKVYYQDQLRAVRSVEDHRACCLPKTRQLQASWYLRQVSAIKSIRTSVARGPPRALDDDEMMQMFIAGGMPNDTQMLNYMGMMMFGATVAHMGAAAAAGGGGGGVDIGGDDDDEEEFKDESDDDNEPPVEPMD